VMVMVLVIYGDNVSTGEAVRRRSAWLFEFSTPTPFWSV
jgi:hypothetical protein